MLFFGTKQPQNSLNTLNYPSSELSIYNLHLVISTLVGLSVNNNKNFSAMDMK